MIKLPNVLCLLIYSKSLATYYVGQTSDLKQRLLDHNKGGNTSTRLGRPWRVVYYEAYTSRVAAIRRQHKLKHHGKGLQELKKRIHDEL